MDQETRADIDDIMAKIVDALPDEVRTSHVITALGMVTSAIFMDQIPETDKRVEAVEHFSRILLKAAHVEHPDVEHPEQGTVN